MHHRQNFIVALDVALHGYFLDVLEQVLVLVLLVDFNGIHVLKFVGNLVEVLSRESGEVCPGTQLLAEFNKFFLVDGRGTFLLNILYQIDNILCNFIAILDVIQELFCCLPFLIHRFCFFSPMIKCHFLFDNFSQFLKSFPDVEVGVLVLRDLFFERALVLFLL